MDNQNNLGKDKMYSGTLGGNINRGAANFTPSKTAEPEIRKASVATYTDINGNKKYIDDPLPEAPKEIPLTSTNNPNVYITPDGELVTKEDVVVPKLKRAKMEPSNLEDKYMFKLLQVPTINAGGM